METLNTSTFPVAATNILYDVIHSRVPSTIAKDAANNISQLKICYLHM